MKEWEPAYPGQPTPVWTWWDRDDSEEGLVGFLTEEDRDMFSAGEKGPYRRVISPHGKTISQLEGWSDMIKRWTKEVDEE